MKSKAEKKDTGDGHVSDPLDLEIAEEINQISHDIKNILSKIDTLYPIVKDQPASEDKNKPEQNPGK